MQETKYLSDILSRLPYNLESIVLDTESKIRLKVEKVVNVDLINNTFSIKSSQDGGVYIHPMSDFIPVLRKMEDMSDDEYDDLRKIIYASYIGPKTDIGTSEYTNAYQMYNFIDYCKQHNLDVFGWIDKNLAIDKKIVDAYFEIYNSGNLPESIELFADIASYIVNRKIEESLTEI